MASVIQIIVGLFQLLLGRKLFWLMVGAAGFLSGLFLMHGRFDWPAWQELLVSLVAGIIFSLLAVWLQKPTAAIVAFLAFGIAALIIVRLLGIGSQHPMYWVFFVIGGVIGAILTFAVYEWTLIMGTSILGAGSISTGLSALLGWSEGGILGSIVFLVLLAVGISVQAKSLRSKNS